MFLPRHGDGRNVPLSLVAAGRRAPFVSTLVGRNAASPSCKDVAWNSLNLVIAGIPVTPAPTETPSSEEALYNQTTRFNHL